MNSRTSTHISLEDPNTIQFHCSHTDGEHSWMITPLAGGNNVYLTGTVKQLEAFSRAVAIAALERKIEESKAIGLSAGLT